MSRNTAARLVSAGCPLSWVKRCSRRLESKYKKKQRETKYLKVRAFVKVKHPYGIIGCDDRMIRARAADIKKNSIQFQMIKGGLKAAEYIDLQRRSVS